jgi:Tfp pilus assembly protein PilN
MPVKLNLLPQGLLISKSLGKALKTIKALNVILSVAFLVFALGMGAYFVLSTITLNGVQNKVDKLKTQVIAQESSEQQLILLKDRIQKISTVKALPNTFKNVENINSLLTGLSGESSISQLDVGQAKVDLSMIIKSNNDLTSFLRSVENTNLFKTVILSSFGYSPVGGYTLGISFTGK